MKRYIAYLLCVASVVGGGLFLTSIHAPHTSTDTASLRARIAEIGSLSAYDELMGTVASLDPSEQHKAGHFFGDALYTENGIAGITVCDSRLSYGCFHQLVGEAIAHEGLDVIAEFDDTCKKQTGCVHGIGHGLLGYMGYGTSSLEHALSVCDGLTYDDSLQGCVAGVYMEYNLRTMIGVTSGSSTVRQAHVGEFFAPCDSASISHAKTCYLWQPTWWYESLSAGESYASGAVYREMANLCTSLKNPILRDSCIEGAGMHVPHVVSYSPARAARLCDESFSSDRSKTLCFGHAAAVMRAGISEESALSICENLTDAVEHTYCEKYARGQATISKPIPFESL